MGEVLKALSWYFVGLENALAGRGEEGGRGLEAYPSSACGASPLGVMSCSSPVSRPSSTVGRMGLHCAGGIGVSFPRSALSGSQRSISSSPRPLSGSTPNLSNGDSRFVIPESSGTIGVEPVDALGCTCFCVRWAQGEGGGSKNALVPIPVCVCGVRTAKLGDTNFGFLPVRKLRGV